MMDSCCLVCVMVGTCNRTKPTYNVAKEKKETVKDFILYHTGLWGDFYEPNHSKLILRCSFRLLDLTPAPFQPSSVTSRKSIKNARIKCLTAERYLLTLTLAGLTEERWLSRKHLWQGQAVFAEAPSVCGFLTNHRGCLCA